MKKGRIKFLTIPVLCGLCSLIFVVTSCKHKRVEVIDEEVTKDTISEGVKNSLESISVNIPSPLEVTGEISGAGISFNKNIINPTSKASSYSTSGQKALALGIYGSDLGYVTGFKQMQDALGYIGTVKKLAEETGVSSAYDEPAIKRIVENMSKPDSAAKTNALIKEVYGKAERNLRSHQRIEIAGLVVASGWVEGLYVAVQALGDVQRDAKTEKLYTRIWNQVFSYQYVAQFLNENQKNADFAKLIEELKDVEKLCKGLENRPKLSNADIQTIKEKITVVRNKITG